MRFIVEGTDAHGNLTSDKSGKTAPYAVFDVKYQDWIIISPDRSNCEAIAILLNA